MGSMVCQCGWMLGFLYESVRGFFVLWMRGGLGDLETRK